MITSRWTLVATLAVALGAGASRAAQLGDAAPPLKVANWVKGKEVELAEGKGKNVYVVEFWATWCGPCRASIPHLSELQAKFKDKGVVFIGVSDEQVGTVKPFVKDMGEKMAYTVAVDDHGDTTAAYMRAFGINGIPHAFIIDRSGKIAWHDHPMAGLDKALERVVSGSYDIQAARKAHAARDLLAKYFDRATKKGHGKAADKLGVQIVTDGASDAALMQEFAMRILTDKEVVSPNYDLARRAGKAAYDNCDGRDPEIVATYALALSRSGDAAESKKLQAQAMQLCSSDDGLRKQVEEILKGAPSPNRR